MECNFLGYTLILYISMNFGSYLAIRLKMPGFASVLKDGQAFSAFAPFRVRGKQRLEMPFRSRLKLLLKKPTLRGRYLLTANRPKLTVE